jgi:hypothetical protein
LPEPDVADVGVLDVVVLVVAGTTAETLGLVVPVEVVCVLPLVVEGAVVLDWSSSVVGSDAVVLVVAGLPLPDPVWSSEPFGWPLPSLVEVVPELSVAPVVVLDGDCAAGSAMWPARPDWL